MQLTTDLDPGIIWPPRDKQQFRFPSLLHRQFVSEVVSGIAALCFRDICEELVVVPLALFVHDEFALLEFVQDVFVILLLNILESGDAIFRDSL